MDDRWSRMTIPQIRKENPSVPKRLKKKCEILEFLNDEHSVSTSSSPVVTHQPPPMDITRFFVRATTTDAAACSFCDNERFTWTELGRAWCPICRSSKLHDDGIKREKSAITYYSYSPSGELVFHVDGLVTKDALSSLVTVYGFGTIESIDALIECKNDIQAAACKLVDATRAAAENYSIAQAQLNSEEDLVEQRAIRRADTACVRKDITNDLSLFGLLDPDFSIAYLSRGNPLLDWAANEPENSLLLFDYLNLKKDAVKWYKQHARSYFNTLEINHFTHNMDTLSSSLSQAIQSIQEAMYSLPENGGAIPKLFRATEPQVGEEDIEVVGVVQPESRVEQFVMLD
jgi:hypothetical protein